MSATLPASAKAFSAQARVGGSNKTLLPSRLIAEALGRGLLSSASATSAAADGDLVCRKCMSVYTSVMRKSDELRRERIAEAAYTLIRERGYRRASLLEIAKSAGVSNQTMYRWYGSKRGLFGALIEANATRAAAAIDQALVDASRPEDALREVALLVLRTVTSDRAVDLNRAAAADASDTGELGAALARAGRDLIIPRVARLVERAHQRGDLTAPDAAAAAEMWVSLVIGDLQIRVVTGAIPTPPDDELRRRAATGCLAFLFLYAPSTPITIGEPS